MSGLKSLFGKKDYEIANKELLPYQLRGHFLTPSEFAFYKMLRLATADAFVICPKVNLTDLFLVVAKHKETKQYLQYIESRHVDFLLCNIKTMEPVLGLELDQESYQLDKTPECELLIDDIFLAAGLPLARVFISKSYNLTDLREYVFEAAGLKQESGVITAEEVEHKEALPREGPEVSDRAEQLHEQRQSKEIPGAVEEKSPDQPVEDSNSVIPTMDEVTGEPFKPVVLAEGESAAAAAVETEGAAEESIVLEVKIPVNDKSVQVDRTGIPGQDQEQPEKDDSSDYSLEKLQARVIHEAAAAVGNKEVPLCRQCKIPMELRTSKRGFQFYCCPNFARCREVRGLYE